METNCAFLLSGKDEAAEIEDLGSSGRREEKKNEFSMCR